MLVPIVLDWNAYIKQTQHTINIYTPNQEIGSEWVWELLLLIVLPMYYFKIKYSIIVPTKLKGIIVKNIEGNRGKLGIQGGIWRYRALNSDYYIFKHEYIFVFRKEE